jgi:P-type Ca2+ transporter type 2C
MDFILVLFICISVAYLVSWLCRKVGLPHILGHLTAGLIISIPVISDVLFADQAATRLFSSLANLGLIFLLFFIGLKIDLSSLVRFSKKSVNIALLSALVPFSLGFGLGQLLHLGFASSLILGACLSVTAEAVSGAILEELGMLNSRIGVIVIEAGIIDDIFEILTLAAIGTIIQSHSQGIVGSISGVGNILIDVIVFIGLIYLVRFVFIPTTFNLLGKRPNHSDLFTASFIVVLLMAAIANYLQLGTVIGALIAGVIVKQTLLREHKKEQEAEVVDMIETVTFGFLEPLFFIWIAYTADFFGNIGSSKTFFVIAFLITIVATGGKIIGSVVGNWLDKGTLREGILIGWGMNARGAVELIAIKMAYDNQLVSPIIYSSVVFMTFVTTIFSPILFKVIAQYHARAQKSDAVQKPTA